MKKILITTVIVSLTIIGIASLYLDFEKLEQIRSYFQSFSTQETAIDHAKKHTNPKYVCPMHPQIVRDQKGSCPICGMNLIKKAIKTPNQTDSEAPSISVKASTAQSMGIKIATVKRQTLSREIKTVGFIRYNEDKLEHIHIRTKGWIENIYIKSQGEVVKEGQILFDYYSPELVAAQEDYLLALKGNSLLSETRSRGLLDSAQLRMRLLGIPEIVISKISRTKISIKQIPIYAPSDGTIIKLDVRKGMYIIPATVLYSIVDLSSVWIEVDVFEHQLNWVKIGDSASIQIEALADKTWQGKVDYIYPELSEVTRTLRVRLVFDNSKGHFKPNMFADIRMQGNPIKRLVIPNEAIIFSAAGKRVVKQVGKHRYQPIEIKTGIHSQGKTEILSGLKAGDKVVISSQFLLDSESNLQASFNRLSE